MKYRLSKYDKIFIVLMITSIVIIGGTITYAFYQSSIKGTISGTIARWSFTANNKTDSFNIDLGAGYPGKKDVYDLELSAVNSDLDVYYEIFVTFDRPDDWVSTLILNNKYVGRCINSAYPGIYGIIPKGAIKTIKLRYYFPYKSPQLYLDRDHYTFQIKAQQKTGYSGSIPMKLFGTSYTYEVLMPHLVI